MRMVRSGTANPGLSVRFRLAPLASLFGSTGPRIRIATIKLRHYRHFGKQAVSKNQKLGLGGFKVARPKPD
jgi:hypothetical protein